ncbi:MAG TPA: glycosyltransferase [Microlunatus sp.]|nr:glycosyltransferase [Microlunatus sp.]
MALALDTQFRLDDHGPALPDDRRLHLVTEHEARSVADSHRDPVGDHHEHEIAVVVLTQGTRPAELACALASIRAQQRVDAQVILVVNGGSTHASESVDRRIELPRNLGIPYARNIGAWAADARLIMFLDDDAQLLDPHALATVVQRFAERPDLGAMALRLVDEQGHTQRRHIPRLGSNSAERSGPVTHFVGAACVVRNESFRRVDGFDRRFFYAMEESDLSWRLLDDGWSIWYSADLRAFHPRTSPSRHAGYVRLTARNRMWMAWRSLPVPLLMGYLLTWTAAATLRGASWREVFAGYREAWSALPPRRTMRWRTVATMTALGRPPIV